MTLAELARASGAPAKWIQNTRRLLRRPVRSNASEARWLSLVHELHISVGLLLKQAAHCADLVRAAPPEQHHITIDFGDSRRAAIVIDLWRDQTLHLARMSRVLEMPPAERRGRKPVAKVKREDAVQRAITYGVDVTLLHAGRRLSTGERLSRLDDNAALIAEARKGRVRT